MTGKLPDTDHFLKPPLKQDSEQQFVFVLPVKITGIVFWGLALVGLTIAVFLLQGKEKELQDTYQKNMILFAAQLEKELPQVFFNKKTQRLWTESP